MQGEDCLIRLCPHILQDTLKPLTVTSLSEISSEDIDLEYDLYDCDLNNVSAQPGSMFAHATYHHYYDQDYDVDGSEVDFDELMAGATASDLTPTR